MSRNAERCAVGWINGLDQIDAALYDAALHSNLVDWAEETASPRPAGRPLPLSGSLACYYLYRPRRQLLLCTGLIVAAHYRTADGGIIALACFEPHFWQRFCAAAGRPDLVKLHLDTRPEAKKRVQELVGGRPRADWETLAPAHDLPLEPVLSAAETADHPQARHRGLVTTGPDGLPRLAYPARTDGRALARWQIRRKGPKG